MESEKQENAKNDQKVSTTKFVSKNGKWLVTRTTILEFQPLTPEQAQEAIVSLAK